MATSGSLSWQSVQVVVAIALSMAAWKVVVVVLNSSFVKVSLRWRVRMSSMVPEHQREPPGAARHPRAGRASERVERQEWQLVAGGRR